MATSSVPSLNMNSGWGDPPKSSQSQGHNSIELGMSDMSLLSSLGNGSQFPTKNTDGLSQFSEEFKNTNYEQQNKNNIDSGDSVNSQRSNGGLAASVPSPMTSQTHTLTPTSSLDGASDLYNVGRQSVGKDEHDLPSKITTTIVDSFEGGYHGLRERANTAPGPINYPGNGFSGGEQTRPRAFSREASGRAQSSASSRPPLAGTSYSQESGSALGIISRPGFVQHSGEYDSTLRRSTSETGRDSHLNNPYPGGLDHQHLSDKFGSLRTLGSHLNQQRAKPGQQPFQALQRHQRSQSQPASAYGHYQDEELHRNVSDYGGAMLPPNDYSMQSHDSRYLNLPPGSDGTLHRRNLSQQPPGVGGSGFYGSQNNPNFGSGHSRYPEPAPIIASSDEMRMYMTQDYDRNMHERLVSPGHSPLHTHYGSHTRNHSDSLNSSSPMSLGSSGVRGITGQSRNTYGSHHRVPSLEDDSSHPLVGENIEVPADDHAYMRNEGASLHPSMIRTSSTGRPGSADVVPPHYGGAETAHHLSAAGAAFSLPKLVYSVKFKRTQRSFVVGPRLNRDLKVGTYVKVEADRGEDLGIVVGKVAHEKQGRSNFRGDMGMTPSTGSLGGSGNTDMKRIIRLATHDEVSLLAMKREEEEELLKICRTKVQQRALPMNVVDAEYQFDRHKLTFFFEAEGRVDFRELVRDLFSIYKTRIWMQQLDKNTSVTCHAAVNPPSAVAMDYGTPIIAPVSEFREFVTSGEILDGTE